MRDKLIRSIRHGDSFEMMYLASGGAVSKRRIKVLQVGQGSFRAYCFLRKSGRTFKIDNILALVPLYRNESQVI